jgi:uncharacterized repeat protein (TIGR01451 family)
VLEARTTPTVVNLTSAGSSGSILGAQFVQSTSGAGGTGNIQSFVRIQKNGVEQGYNTSSRPLQFDENNSPNFTRSFQLGSVAEVNNGGTLYYEFLLDINQQNSGGNALLSLDQLRLYVSPTDINTSANNFANGYNPATGTLGGLSPSYSMNPVGSTTNFVELNGALKAGSGTPDMTLFVPVSDLGTNPNSWIYLYSQFGGHTFTSDQGNTGGAANDGFEEWANTTVGKPTIATTAGPNVVLGSGNALTDSATLAGGKSPTGTITFTLFDPTGATAYTNVVTVTGNKTYHSTDPGTTTGSAVPTMVGTYQWVVSYSGDLSNNPVSSTKGQEPETVEECRVLLGPPTETDTVGDHATFTAEVDTTTDGIHWTHVGAGVPVTFSLVNNTAGATIVTTSTGSNPANTDSNGEATVTITSANPGSVNIHASTTFTLAGVLGTFNCATGMAPSDNDAQKTFVTGTLTTPMIDTSAGPTVALDGITPLTDSATLTGGNNPTGTITFTLFDPTDTTVYTNTVAVNGNNTYLSNVPTGTTTGSAVPTMAGTYQWVASHSGDSLNNSVSSVKGSEPQNVVDANISISPLTPVNEVNQAETFTITVTAFPAGTGTPTFTTPTVTFPGGAPGTVGPVTPLAGPTDNGNGSWTETWTETINNATAGTFTEQASDMVTMGGVTVTRTTGDNLSDDSPSAVKTYESITTEAGPAVTLGDGTPLTDSATLAGGTIRTGTVTFELFAPGVNPDQGGIPVYTDVVTLIDAAAPVTVTTSMGNHPGGFVPTTAGTYEWVVTFNSTDEVNPSVSSNFGDEPQTVITPPPPIPPAADVMLTKVVSPTNPIFGTPVTYTLIAHNNGPDTATNVVVTDILPTGVVFVSATPSQGSFNPASGIWIIGTLPNGASATLQITCIVTTIGPFTNTSSVAALEFDPDLTNNVSSATIDGMFSAEQISKRLFLSSSDSPLNPAMLAAEEGLFNVLVPIAVNIWDTLLSVAQSMLAARNDPGPGNGGVPVFESNGFGSPFVVYANPFVGQVTAVRIGAFDFLYENNTIAGVRLF